MNLDIIFRKNLRLRINIKIQCCVHVNIDIDFIYMYFIKIIYLLNFDCGFMHYIAVDTRTIIKK